MARRRKNTRGNRIADSAKESVGRLITDWFTLTWATDRTKIGPVPIVVFNWLILIGLGAAVWWKLANWKTLCTIATVWILFTIGRAATIMPARRKTLQTLYEQNQRTAALPRGSYNNPVSPHDLIHVRAWGKKSTPTDLTMTIGDCPAATSVYAQVQVEKSLAASLGEPKDGMVWLFDWPSNTKVHCKHTAADSSEALQQEYRNHVRNITGKMLRVKPRDADEYHFECSEWMTSETKTGAAKQIPQLITITLGDFDYTDPIQKDQAERTLDKRLHAPGEWIYTWDDDTLEMRLVPRKSQEAIRKLTTRKISDDVIGLLRQGRGVDIPQTSVVTWFAGENAPPNHPKLLRINFGTRNLADRRVRDEFESSFDTAMAATYHQVTWLFDWKAGSNTSLLARAVSLKSKQALRKKAERRLRNVVESKFGSSKNFVDCDILEWWKDLTPAGEALPQKAVVDFGDYDVTKPETQDAFEMHWDSTTTECDWHYSWSPAEGVVTIESVPALPTLVFFPEPGDPEFDYLNDKACKGKFIFGPRKGGGEVVWDMNSTPHGLIGGKTGSGKSVALNLPLFFALYNPHWFDCIVIDRKRTDYTWTPEFPNVLTFAATDVEIVAALQAAHNEMDNRLSLLNKAGCRNLRELRSKMKRNPELEAELGPAPKRLIILFDELAEFLAKGADSDMEKLKDEARANLEALGRLARAVEVNLVTAAQKPDAKIISTQLRSQLGFRMGVGRLDKFESEMILDSDHGTRFPSEGVPKGRAWANDPQHGYQLAQVFFLADESGPLDWMPDKTVIGMVDMVRNRLRELGYVSYDQPNRDGGSDARWARVESDAESPTFDDVEVDQHHEPDELESPAQIPTPNADQPEMPVGAENIDVDTPPRLTVVPSDGEERPFG